RADDGKPKDGNVIVFSSNSKSVGLRVCKRGRLDKDLGIVGVDGVAFPGGGAMGVGVESTGSGLGSNWGVGHLSGLPAIPLFINDWKGGFDVMSRSIGIRVITGLNLSPEVETQHERSEEQNPILDLRPVLVQKISAEICLPST